MAWCVPGSPADGQPGLSGARSLTHSLSQSVIEDLPGAHLGCIKHLNELLAAAGE